MKCNRCGAALPNNSYICQQCGALMSIEQIEFQKKFNKENNLNMTTYNQKTNINYEKHDTNYSNLIAIIFFVLLLIAGIILVFYLKTK